MWAKNPHFNSFYMNILIQSNCFKPSKIQILLIGEAPPPNSDKHFYVVPQKYKPSKLTIDRDSSLPSTIFNHYFKRLPTDELEYEVFLKCLMNKGIFLIDIINERLEIKKWRQPVNQTSVSKLISNENLNDLKCRIKKLIQSDTKIIFLLPTGRPYVKKLREEFQDASFVNWKCFRLDTHEAEECEKETSP